MKFLENPIWLLAFTLAMYGFGLILSRRYRWILFNPIIVSTTILIVYLLFLEIPYQVYYQAGQYIDFLLKPSIVALAVPLYIQWERIKIQMIPILVSQLVGSLVGIISIVILAKITQCDKQMLLSLVPKSISTPMALEVSASIGGVPSVTAAAVILTGIFGSMVGFQIMRRFNIGNPISQGIAMGTSSHALGTLKAMTISQSYGAFASVGMILNGVFTAILAPLVLNWLSDFL